MKRYCLLFFSLLLSLSTLNAQNVDGWDKMKEIYLSILRYPGANFQELSEESEYWPYAACDFQADKWQYTILSKEDRTVSVHPILYFYYTGNDWAPYSWTPDTTLTGTIEIPSHVTYNDTVYTVTTITEGAFSYCISIDSLVVPETITCIEDAAFTQNFIKSYTFLGKNLNKVGSGAFETEVVGAYDGVIYNEYDGIIHRHCYMYSETPPEGVVFLSPDGKKRNGLLHVPVGCKEAYQQAEGWSQYGDRIVDDIDLSGVHSIKNEELKMNNGMFDLQGRRVTEPQKGKIYIQNGKKYINK